MKRVSKIGLYLSFLALTCLVAAAPAQAGGCASHINRAVYSSAYVAPAVTYQQQHVVYAQVLAVPVALFQFVQPATYAAQQTTVTQQTTTTAATAASVGATTSSTSLLSDAQVKLLAAEIVRGLRADQGPEPEPTPAPKPKKETALPMPREGASGSAPATGNKVAVVYQSAAIMAVNCASCHTAPTVKGKVTLFNEQNQFAPSVTPAAIFAAVQDDSMPHGASKKLAAGDKEILRQWAELSAAGG